jgi:hypothetical protein
VRRTAAAVLVVLAAVLPAVAVASWLAYGDATDRERFTATADELVADRTVQREVADRLIAAAGADPALAAEVPGVARRLADTPEYRAAWRSTVRALHGRLSARLDGDVTAPLTLDLTRLAAVLRAQVAAAGVPSSAAAQIPAPRPVVIADRAEIRRAHDATQAVRIVRAIAIPGAVLALLGVLLTAPRAASGVLRVAGCLACSAALLLAARALGADRADPGVPRAVYDVLTRPLGAWITGGFVAAGVAAIVGVVLTAAGARGRAGA